MLTKQTQHESSITMGTGNYRNFKSIFKIKSIQNSLFPGPKESTVHTRSKPAFMYEIISVSHPKPKRFQLNAVKKFLHSATHFGSLVLLSDVYFKKKTLI